MKKYWKLVVILILFGLMIYAISNTKPPQTEEERQKLLTSLMLMG